VSGGVCADCWGVKDPDRAIVAPPPEPRTEPLFGWDFDWLGIHPLGAFALAVGIVGAVAVVVLRALF
jgi:hypothetical protein